MTYDPEKASRAFYAQREATRRAKTPQQKFKDKAQKFLRHLRGVTSSGFDILQLIEKTTAIDISVEPGNQNLKPTCVIPISDEFRAHLREAKRIVDGLAKL